MGDTRSTYQDLQRQHSAAKATQGDAFQYSRYAQQTHAGVHQILDIMNGRIRESANAEATNITIVVDQTGSNLKNPVIIRDNIAKLLGLLTLQGYVKHPAIQLIFMGDSRSDQYWIQISEFESAIEQIEEILTHAILEGEGGGQRREDYGETALVIMNKNRILNSNPRFVFFIGDEAPYEVTEAARMRSKYGLTHEMEDMTREKIFADLREWSNDLVYLIRCKDTQYFNDQDIVNVWKKLLPAEHILNLDNAEGICDLIAGVVGYNSGIRMDQLNRDLNNDAIQALVPIVDNAMTSITKNNNRNIRRIR